MKKTVVWLVRVLILCVVFTVACSPYELKDPTQARIIMLEERNARESDEAAKGTSGAAPESSPDGPPQSQR